MKSDLEIAQQAVLKPITTMESVAFCTKLSSLPITMSMQVIRDIIKLILKD